MVFKKSSKRQRGAPLPLPNYALDLGHACLENKVAQK